MTLQQLKYFLAAFEHGSFSGAADALRLAQPSVSMQIRRLESELGVALFNRVGRGLVPTEAALTIRDHAEMVLAAVEETRQSVNVARQLQGGTATFGMFGSARFYPIAAIVEAFTHRHPLVGVRLVGLNSPAVANAVRAGQLETGLIMLPVDDHGLHVRPIMRDELVYVSADPSVLTGPKDIDDLHRRPLALSSASFGDTDSFRRQLHELCQRYGRRLSPHIEVEDAETAIDLAARGVADTVIAKGLLNGLGERETPDDTVLQNLGHRIPGVLGWQPFREPIYIVIALVCRQHHTMSLASQEFLHLATERLTAFAEELEIHPPRARIPHRIREVA